MARIPTPASLGANRGRSRVGSGGNLVNLYPEQSPDGARNPAWLNGTPGTALFCDLAGVNAADTSPVRGVYRFKGFLYAVTQKGFYEIDGAGTATLKAAISVGARVSFADNGIVMVFVDGSKGWAWNGTSLAEIREEGFYPADNVDFLDQYFIFNRSGTGQFFWSSLLAVFDGDDLDPLDFATAEYAPDDTVAILANQSDLWLFGTRTVEAWRSVGTEAVFTRIPGAVIDVGCAGPYARAKADSVVYWLTPDGEVYRAAGYVGNKISTHAVDHDMEGRDLSTAEMWSYKDEGHTFIMLTLPEATRSVDGREQQFPAVTWCFDTVTGNWHIRRHVDYGRHIGSSYAYAFDKHLVGSFVDSKIYRMGLDLFEDAERPLVAELWYSPQHNNRGRMFHHSFEVDGDWGHPDKVTVTTEVTSPAIVDQQFYDFTPPASGNVPAFTAATPPETMSLIEGSADYADTQYTDALPVGTDVMRIKGQFPNLSTVGVYFDLVSEGFNPDVGVDILWSGLAAGTTGNTYLRFRYYQADVAGGGTGAVDAANFGLPPDAENISLVYDSGLLQVGASITLPDFSATKRYFSFLLTGGSNDGVRHWERSQLTLTGSQDATVTQTVTQREPKASLDWSDDGGATWSNERVMSVGRIGNRAYRFIARRLGQARDRIYRLRMDGNHPRRISALGFVEADAER